LHAIPREDVQIVLALGDAKVEGLLRSVLLEIFPEFVAQMVDMYAHDRIAADIELPIALQHIDGDRYFLGRRTRDGAAAKVAQDVGVGLRFAKRATVHDALDKGFQLLRVHGRFRIHARVIPFVGLLSLCAVKQDYKGPVSGLDPGMCKEWGSAMGRA